MTTQDQTTPMTESRGFGSVSGQSVLITGAGSGVGRGMAHAFATSGARVVIAELRAEAGEQTAEEIRSRGGDAVSIECDVTHRGDVEAAVPVLDDDTVESLSARILKKEHRIYSEAIEIVLSGLYRVENRRVLLH